MKTSECCIDYDQKSSISPSLHRRDEQIIIKYYAFNEIKRNKCL